MFRQNNIFMGVISAILISCLTYFVFTLLNENLIGQKVGEYMFLGVRERFLIILGVFSNIIPFSIYNRRRMTRAMRGVGYVTIIEVVVLVIYMFR